MKFSDLIILPSLALLFFSCGQSPDTEKIDRLIAQKQYHAAVSLIHKELQKEYDDTLQYRRLQYRLIKIEKFSRLDPIDSLIAAKKFAQANDSLQKLNYLLNGVLKNKQKYYLFDLHYRRALILEALNQDSLWFIEANKALENWTDEYALKRELYQKLAFFLARRGKYDDGRKMMDYSLREVTLRSMSDSIKKAYFAYLNGEFKLCLDLMKKLPPDKKDRHWRKLELFLSQYGDSLSLNDRFTPY